MRHGRGGCQKRQTAAPGQHACESGSTKTGETLTGAFAATVPNTRSPLPLPRPHSTTQLHIDTACAQVSSKCATALALKGLGHAGRVSDTPNQTHQRTVNVSSELRAGRTLPMGVAHSGHKPCDVAPRPVISRLAHGTQHRECPQGWNRVLRGASRQMPHSAPSSDPAVACRTKPWGEGGGRAVVQGVRMKSYTVVATTTREGRRVGRPSHFSLTILLAGMCSSGTSSLPHLHFISIIRRTRGGSPTARGNSQPATNMSIFRQNTRSATQRGHAPRRCSPRRMRSCRFPDPWPALWPGQLGP
jgi:hypothetical protein